MPRRPRDPVAQRRRNQRLSALSVLLLAVGVLILVYLAVATHVR